MRAVAVKVLGVVAVCLMTLAGGMAVLAVHAFRATFQESSLIVPGIVGGVAIFLVFVTVIVIGVLAEQSRD